MMKTLKKKIRKWLELDLSDEEKAAMLKSIVEEMDKEPAKVEPAYLLANRHYFLSIKPEDVDEYLEISNESDRRAYEAEASTVFNSKVFKKELKHLLAVQALFVANEAKNWDQNLIGRGNVNGIGLVLDRFEELNSRHLDNVKRPEPPIDKHGLLPD